MIDLEMVTMGYLPSPDGTHYRHVPGLDAIAEDTICAGVSVRWGTPDGGAAACAYLWSRLIVLDPALWRQSGCTIRKVWRHELGHLVTGSRCERIAAAWAGLAGG